MTVEDYFQTPDGPPWFELIDGVLVEEPAASFGHQGILRELFGALWAWNKAQEWGQLWCSPADVVLSEHDVLLPDILLVRGSRLSIVRNGRLYGPPDVAVEIVSPSNARHTREVKRVIYARAGVEELWMVELELGKVLLYRLADDPVAPARTFGAGDVLASLALPGFAVPVRQILVSL